MKIIYLLHSFVHPSHEMFPCGDRMRRMNPASCPDLLVYARRWADSSAGLWTLRILCLQTEVTDRMLIFGQRHRRTILAQYDAHYNGRRPHRSRQLHPPRPDHPPAELSQARIQRRPVLGGLISEYERVA